MTGYRHVSRVFQSGFEEHDKMGLDRSFSLCGFRSTRLSDGLACCERFQESASRKVLFDSPFHHENQGEPCDCTTEFVLERENFLAMKH